jgi:hypothetical protein
MSTHNAHPTIKWDNPSTPDVDGHTVGYQLWVGSSINTSNIFESPIQTQSQYALPQDLEYDADGNKTYHLTVIAIELIPMVTRLIIHSNGTETIKSSYHYVS